MFNELYKKTMDDVKPDELLIKRTKNLMHKEIKKKPKSFYKYATVAACLIITFSLFRVTFYSASNNVSVSDTMEVTNSNGGASVDSLSTPNTGGLPAANNFIATGNSSSIKGFYETTTSDAMLSSGDNIFVRIIKGIVRWFKNLFSFFG